MSSGDLSRTLRRRLRRRRRWPFAIALLVLLVAGFLALLARLLDGPIWTEYGAAPFAERIESAIGPDAEVTVGVVGLSIDEGWRPALHLRDVVVRRGTVRISLNTATVVTRELGTLEVERVLADHALVELLVRRPIPSPAEILAVLDAALASPPLRYLEIGALTLVRHGPDGARFTSLDRVGVTVDGYEEAHLSVQVTGAGAAGPWSIRANASPEPGNGTDPGRRRLAIKGAGLDLADLAAMSGVTEPPVTGPVALEGTAEVADGRFVGGEGQLTLGPLSSGHEAARAIVGAGSRLGLSLRPDGRTLVLLPSRVVIPGGQATVGGTVVLPAGAEMAVPFDLSLDIRSTGADGRRGTGSIRGSYDAAMGLLVVDQFEVAGVGAAFNAAMRLSHGPDQVVGGLSGVFPTLSVEVLKALWPTVMVSEARRWVLEHVESGEVKDATVDLAVADSAIGRTAAGTASAALAFRFEDLAFRPYRDGPMIRGGFGSARLADGRFEVLLERGSVDLGGDGALAVSNARFTIPDVLAKPPTGEMVADIEGPASSALALVKSLPVAAARDLPFAPADAAGTASATVMLELPLKNGLKAGDIRYDAKVHLTELGLAKPVRDRTLSDGDIDIQVTDGMATITGDALLDGVRAEIDLGVPLGGEGASISAVRLRLTDEDRDRLGLGLGEMVKGPVLVSLDTAREAGGAEVQTITVDIGPAEVRIGALGFVKPKKEPGSVRFKMLREDGRTRITDLVLQAAGSRIAGDVTLDDKGRLLSANLPTLAISRGDKVSLTARRDNAGVLQVSLKGSSFDAKKLVRELLRGGETGPGKGSVRVEATIDRVIGFHKERLDGFNLGATIIDGKISDLTVFAETQGARSAAMTLAPAGSQRLLEIEAGDIGRLIRFTGVYQRIYGGRASVTGVLDAAGGVKAAIDGRGWRIVDEPALARLSTAAEKGKHAGVATAEIKRLLFELSFANGVLTIDDGVVRGVTAGLSIQGEVDFARGAIRLGGSYLPASVLDSLLGSIPIIGQTVFAGGRAGLLGVTFRLTGPIEDPTLTVNPLSAIAPGIFRKLFELR